LNKTTRHINDLPEGDVIINVKYSSLNYKDALSATGNKGVTRNYPHTPGIDAAGIVVQSNDASLKIGAEVLVTGYTLGMSTSGGYGEYIRVPAQWVVKLPLNLFLRESMIYGTAGFTAALSVYKLVNSGVKPIDGDILVTGSTGGVGSILATAIKTTNYGGSVTCCGNVASDEFKTSVYPFILKGISVLGIDSVKCPMDVRLQIWNKLS
jgi:putative YhdH/YhfP family quinone oxidoreductase